LGWLLDIPSWTDWFGYGISIQPNTALAGMCGGGALLLLAREHRRLAALLGVIVCLLGSSALFQYATGIDLGIDTLLLMDRTWGAGGTLVRGRMGLPAALSLTLLGPGLACAGSCVPWKRRTATALALITAALASFSLIVYLFGVDVLRSVPPLTTIALQTVIMILAMALGLVASVPEEQPMRLLAERNSPGMLARRLLPLMVLLPILLGLLRHMGEHWGLYGTAFGTAVLVMA